MDGMDTPIYVDSLPDQLDIDSVTYLDEQCMLIIDDLTDGSSREQYFSRRGHKKRSGSTRRHRHRHQNDGSKCHRRGHHHGDSCFLVTANNSDYNDRSRRHDQTAVHDRLLENIMISSSSPVSSEAKSEDYNERNWYDIDLKDILGNEPSFLEWKRIGSHKNKEYRRKKKTRHKANVSSRGNEEESIYENLIFQQIIGSDEPIDYQKSKRVHFGETLVDTLPTNDGASSDSEMEDRQFADDIEFPAEIFDQQTTTLPYTIPPDRRYSECDDPLLFSKFGPGTFENKDGDGNRERERDENSNDQFPVFSSEHATTVITGNSPRMDVIENQNKVMKKYSSPDHRVHHFNSSGDVDYGSVGNKFQPEERDNDRSVRRNGVYAAPDTSVFQFREVDQKQILEDETFELETPVDNNEKVQSHLRIGALERNSDNGENESRHRKHEVQAQHYSTEIRSPRYRHISVDSIDKCFSLPRNNQNGSPTDFDITGQTHDVRFPWQRDIAVQCEIYPTKRTLNDVIPEQRVNADLHRIARSRHGEKRAKNSIEELPEMYNEQQIQFRNKQKHSSKTLRPHSITLPDEYSYMPGIGFVLTASIHMANQAISNGRRIRHSIPAVPEERRDRNLSPTQGTVLSFHGSSSPVAGLSNASSSLLTISTGSGSGSETNSLLDIPGEREDILPSPRISPVPWQDEPNRHEFTVTALTEKLTGSTPGLLTVNRMENKRSRRPRKKSSTSNGVEDDSEDDSENSPAAPPSTSVARRGRRAAIFESQEIGDVSPQGSPDASPENSDDEDSADSPVLGGRRRSSLDGLPGELAPPENHVGNGHRSLHPKKQLVKRNTISEFGITRSPSGSTTNLSSVGEDSKKLRTLSILKLIDKRSKSKTSISELEEVLSKLKPSEFKDNNLARYKDVHWSELIASSDKHGDTLAIPEQERNRREAVWELFKSECVFLIDHLMVLKHCFMEPLKKVQVEGHLMYAEPQELFGNLDELCYVSYTFCKDFLSSLLKDMSSTQFGSTNVLISAFERFSAHSRNGEVYHKYCLNYSNALTYLENIRRKNEDFLEFEKWCQQDPRCKRLQLTDLLVSPMQHCTKLPLLLSQIRKYTVISEERNKLTESLEGVEQSLEQLDDKMKWVKNYERVLEIQQQIVWPPIGDLDPKAFIPDFLRPTFSHQPCERLLASPKRQLIYEGVLQLIEQSKSLDMQIFLFDDILLLTRIKKTHRKKQSTPDNSSGIGRQDSGHYFVVYRQPIALDRFSIHDVGPSEASASGLKNAFVLVQISRFQQVIGIFTLQAPNDVVKTTWLQHLRDAKEKYGEGSSSSRQNSFKENKIPRNVTVPLIKEEHTDSIASPHPDKKRNDIKRIHEKAKTIDTSQCGHIPKTDVNDNQSKTRSMDSVYL